MGYRCSGSRRSGGGAWGASARGACTCGCGRGAIRCGCAGKCGGGCAWACCCGGGAMRGCVWTVRGSSLGGAEKRGGCGARACCVGGAGRTVCWCGGCCALACCGGAIGDGRPACCGGTASCIFATGGAAACRVPAGADLAISCISPTPIGCPGLRASTDCLAAKDGGGAGGLVLLTTGRLSTAADGCGAFPDGRPSTLAVCGATRGAAIAVRMLATWFAGIRLAACSTGCPLAKSFCGIATMAPGAVRFM